MLKLPARINELLQQDHALHSFVLRAASIIGPWARDNKTVFFPEYTDHSLVHLNEVIATADSLISDEAWRQLTAEDAAAFVVSVSLHDCALHISEDGFFELISGVYLAPRSNYGCVDPPWPDLWSDFWSEARRFDQRKLRDIFGDAEPIPAVPKDKLALTLRHRLLIGEFLRRHHARLAHEIALLGIPGPDGRRLAIGVAPPDFLDLCGFIARSHNLSMRTAVDALPSDRHRVHLNCHVPFIMAVLRISDFIQIHSARAPNQLLSLKSLSSPISRREWLKHKAVMELHQAHDDPEAIYVNANPDNVHIFLALTALFSDIQAELDQVWAVLGEVYGRLPPLDSLGITVRRIRSSLDDPKAFAKSKNLKYVPRRFRFRTASAELMDLLVAPLYGGRPGIGIRELVQNGVDTCLERDDLLSKGRVPPNGIVTDRDVIVTLELPKKGAARLIVEDYGVGMSQEIIDNYFLNIGASFRSSELWRKDHEVDGRSSVHRTGRFGIGVLAAFLLGNEMTVTTSHISANGKGLAFTCRRGDESIEIKPADFHHGTKIEIPLSEEVAAALRDSPTDWDWFCIEKPKVVRRVVEDQVELLPQGRLVPACGATLQGSDWHRLKVDDFDDVFWAHHSIGRDESALVCNGIFIEHFYDDSHPGISPELAVLVAKSPSLVVFDPDGRLPINLQRDELAGSLPFANELAAAVSRDLVAGVVHSFSGCPRSWGREQVTQAMLPKVKSYDRGYRGPWLAPMMFTRDGVLPTDLSLIRNYMPQTILVDGTNVAKGIGNWANRALIESVDCYLAMDAAAATVHGRVALVRGALGLPESVRHSFFQDMPMIGSRLLLRKAEVDQLVAPGKVPRSRWNKLRLEAENNAWGLWAQGTVPELEESLARSIARIEADGGYGFAVLYLDWEDAANIDDDIKPSLFCQAWLERVHGPVLQFDEGKA